MAAKHKGPNTEASRRREETGLDRLVKEARADPQFFHDLFWNTENVIPRLDYLSRREKAGIMAVDPERLVVGVAGGVRPGTTEVCGVSCAGSCGGTCAASCGGSCGASCGGSCNNSCAGTCGGSCGASCDSSCAGSCAASCVASGDIGGILNEVVLPADLLEAEQVTARVKVAVDAATFSRFQR